MLNIFQHDLKNSPNQQNFSRVVIMYSYNTNYHPNKRRKQQALCCTEKKFSHSIIAINSKHRRRDAPIKSMA